MLQPPSIQIQPPISQMLPVPTDSNAINVDANPRTSEQMMCRYV